MEGSGVRGEGGLGQGRWGMWGGALGGDGVGWRNCGCALVMMRGLGVGACGGEELWGREVGLMGEWGADFTCKMGRRGEGARGETRARHSLGWGGVCCVWDGKLKNVIFVVGPFHSLLSYLTNRW